MIQYTIKFGYKSNDNLVHATHSHISDIPVSTEELKRITTIVSGVEEFVYFEIEEKV